MPLTEDFSLWWTNLSRFAFRPSNSLLFSFTIHYDEGDKPNKAIQNDQFFIRAKYGKS